MSKRSQQLTASTHSLSASQTSAWTWEQSPPSPQSSGARAALDQGFDFVMASSDTAMLAAEASAVARTFKATRL